MMEDDNTLCADRDDQNEQDKQGRHRTRDTASYMKRSHGVVLEEGEQYQKLW